MTLQALPLYLKLHESVFTKTRTLPLFLLSQSWRRQSQPIMVVSRFHPLTLERRFAWRNCAAAQPQLEEIGHEERTNHENNKDSCQIRQ